MSDFQRTHPEAAVAAVVAAQLDLDPPMSAQRARDALEQGTLPGYHGQHFMPVSTARQYATNERRRRREASESHGGADALEGMIARATRLADRELRHLERQKPGEVDDARFLRVIGALEKLRKITSPAHPPAGASGPDGEGQGAADDAPPDLVAQMEADHVQDAAATHPTPQPPGAGDGGDAEATPATEPYAHTHTHRGEGGIGAHTRDGGGAGAALAEELREEMGDLSPA